MAEIAEHRKFSLTELGANHNKFWNVTLLDNGDVFSEWGRQGKNKQSKTWTGAGRSFMEKKIREKEKKGYTENKTVDAIDSSGSSIKIIAKTQLKDIAHKQIKYSSDIVKDLVEFLVRENIHNIMQATGGKVVFDDSMAQFKTTQGVVIPEQIARARELLSDMADLIAKQNWDFECDLNEYLSLIPRDFGMKRIATDYILPNLDAIQKENDILDGLDASFNDIQLGTTVKDAKKKKIDTPKLFDVTLDVVRDRATLARIEKYYERTKKSMHQSHHYKLHKVYEVEINSVKENFENTGKKIGNVQELFHGTKCSNLLAILKKGLIIPPSSSGHVTGRLYGNGVYASDISSKALNYATNFWGSGGSTNRIFMFLCDFAMGNIYYPDGKHRVRYPVSGYDSTFAKAGRGGVYNNEMIVYNVGQVNLKYLIEFEE